VRPEHVLFDLDGTLTDPKEGIVNCIRFAMQQLSLPLDPSASLDWCIGPPLQQSFARLLGPEAHRGQEALDAYRKRFQELGIYENHLYPGIHELLEALGSQAKLYVATSKPSIFAEKIARHFDLEKYFSAVYGSELNGDNSDKAVLIKKIVAAEGMPVSQAVMIGDREHDMLGAVKNQMRGLGAGWGYGSREELLAHGAEAVFENPLSLNQYLLK
jgi:phosphoglycolate phosphatase